MSAYLVSHVTILDHGAFEIYRTRAARSIEIYGGRYLVRGGELVVLEGHLQESTLVIVEFSDVDTAIRWYESEEYATALEVRDRALTRTLTLVQGVSGS